MREPPRNRTVSTLVERDRGPYSSKRASVSPTVVASRAILSSWRGPPDDLPATPGKGNEPEQPFEKATVEFLFALPSRWGESHRRRFRKWTQRSTTSNPIARCTRCDGSLSSHVSDASS